MKQFKKGDWVFHIKCKCDFEGVLGQVIFDDAVRCRAAAVDGQDYVIVKFFSKRLHGLGYCKESPILTGELRHATLKEVKDSVLPIAVHGEYRIKGRN